MAAPPTSDDQPAPRPDAHRPVDHGPIAGGIVVVGIGVFLLFAQMVPDAGLWIPFIIGLVFLAAFVARREYGFLVAGSIIAGVGAGVVLAQRAPSDFAGAAMLLSMAAGFLAIWAISTLLRLPDAHWWPFIPGGILAFIGLVQLSDAGVLRWWPIILVAIGAFVIANSVRRSRRA